MQASPIGTYERESQGCCKDASVSNHLVDRSLSDSSTLSLVCANRRYTFLSHCTYSSLPTPHPRFPLSNPIARPCVAPARPSSDRARLSLAAGLPQLPDLARAPYINPTYPSKAHSAIHKLFYHNHATPTPYTQTSRNSRCSPPPSSSTSTASLAPSAALLPVAIPRPADLAAVYVPGLRPFEDVH
jgi:hypothetical protein